MRASSSTWRTGTTRAGGVRATAVLLVSALAVPAAYAVPGAAAAPAGHAAEVGSEATQPPDLSELEPSASVVARGEVSDDSGAGTEGTQPEVSGLVAPAVNQQERRISFVQPLESPLTHEVHPGCSNPLEVSDSRVGDMNGDSIPDLVTGFKHGCWGNGGVAVMLGQGDGTFADPAVYRLGSSPEYGPRGLALGDFDGNETLDVVVAAYDRRQVEFFANDGTGVLAATVFTPLNNRPWNIVAADVNGDDDLDLVAVTGDAQGISVLGGRGDGTFDSPVELATSESPMQVVVADLDGAAGLDLAVPTWHGRKLDLFFNDGGASGLTFDPRVSVDVHGMWLREVWAGDFTGDATLDLAVEGDWPNGGFAGCSGACLGVLVGDGGGTFTPDATRALSVEPHSNGTGYYTTPPADLEGDSDLDIVLPHQNDAVAVASNDGTGHFTLSFWTNLTGVEPERIVSADNSGPNNPNDRLTRAALPADLNDDGLADLVVSGDVPRGNDGGVTVLLGDADAPGRFVAPEVLPARRQIDPGSRTVAATDWDGDGLGDVLAAGQDGNLVWFRGGGDGTFEDVRAISIPGGLYNRCFSNKGLYPADFDGDDAMDVFCRGGGWVSPATVLYGDGAGDVEQAVVIEPGVDRDWPDGLVTLADLDGDDDIDIVDPRNKRNWDAWAYYRPALNGGASREWTYPPTVNAGHALGQNLQGTAGDFDDDGDTDLAAHPNVNEAGQSVNELRVWLNDGSASFTALPAMPTSVTGAADSDRAVAADLDGDGDDDLVVQQTWSGWWVFLSNGDGTFADPVLEPGAPYVSSIVNDTTIADLDGDGYPELIGLSYGFGLEVLRNAGDGTFEDAPYRFSVGASVPEAVGVGNLNGDTKADLVVLRNAVSAAPLGAQPVVLLNTSTGIDAGAPPDLTVTDLDVPASLTPGDDGAVRYTVHNDGGNAEGPWTDQVWLSADETWDLGDRLLGTHTHPSVAAGQDYAAEVTGPFAPLTDGDHHVIVRLDGRAQLDEDPAGGEANNLSVAGPTSLDIPELAVGGTLDLTLRDGTARYIRIPAAAGQKLRVDLAGPVGNLADVDAVKGKVPVPARDLAMPGVADVTRTLVLPGGDEGTWYLRLMGRAAAGGGTTVNLSADELTFGIVDVSPSRGSNQGQATITITGEGFGEDSTVGLAGEEAARAASRVVRASSATLYATFDLAGLPTGDYDVEVESGGESTSALAAFEVVTGSPGRLDLWVELPGRARAGGRADATITFRNDGDTDIEDAYFRVVPEGMMIAEPGTEEFAGTPVELVTTTPGAPPGMIPAGASGRFVVPAVAGGGGGFSISVESFEAGDPTPLNTAGLILGPEVEGLSGYSKAQVTQQVLADAGPTTGSYVHALNQAALEGAGFGLDLPGMEDRFGHIVDRALLTAEGAPLAGRVVTDDGGTTGEVALALTSEVMAEPSILRTWYDGRFAVWDLPPGGYELQFLGPGIPGEPIELAVATPESQEAELVVAGADLRGDVTRQSDGSAVGLAAVRLADDDHLVASTLATNGGRFAFLGLPDGHYEAAASDEGLAHASIETFELSGSGGTDTRLVLIQAGSVSGQVTDNLGRPVADALVTAGVDGHVLGGGAGLTDAAGAFSVTELAPGSYDLSGFGAVPVAAVVPDVVVTAGEDTAGVSLEVDAGATLAGTVTDEKTGEPVEGAHVALGDGGFTVATGAAGTYEIDGAPSGSHQVAVFADGYASQEATLDLVPGATSTHDLALDPGAIVEGRVERADGAPLVGVDAVISGEGSALASTLTDAEGHFEIGGVADGTHLLAVGNGAASREVTLGGGVDHLDETFVLDAGTIGGRLVDSGGGPVEGLVTISRDGRPIATLATDAAGEFSFVVLDGGPFDIVGGGPGGFPAVTGIVGVPGDDIDVGDLALGDGALQVTVAGPGGAVEDALVRVEPSDTSLPIPSPRGAGTDGSGLAEVAGMLPGEYRVVVSADGFAPHVTTLTLGDGETAELDVELDEGFVLQGRTVDSEGDPVGGARVEAVEHDLGGVGTATAGEDGTFALDGLPSGVYDLVFVAPGQPATVVHDLTVSADDDLGDLAFPAAGDSISGRVVGPAGTPIIASAVVAHDQRGVLVATGVVSAGGSDFSVGPLGDVGPVSLTVIAFAGDPYTETATVTAPATDVVVAVPGAGVLSPLPDLTEPEGSRRARQFGRSRPSSDDPVGLSAWQVEFPKTFHIPTFEELKNIWVGLPEEPQRRPDEQAAEDRLPQLRAQINWECEEQVGAYRQAVKWSNLKEQQFLELEKAYHLWYTDMLVAIGPAVGMAVKLAASIGNAAMMVQSTAVAAAELVRVAPMKALFFETYGPLVAVLESLQTNLAIIVGANEWISASLYNLLFLAEGGKPQFDLWDTITYWLKPFALTLLETAHDIGSFQEFTALSSKFEKFKSVIKILGPVAVLIEIINDAIGLSEELYQSLLTLGSMSDRREDSKRLYDYGSKRFIDAVNHLGRVADPDAECKNKVDPTRKRGMSGSIVISSDPNEIVGPGGFGDPGWLPEEQPLGYTVSFENLGDGSELIPEGQSKATAPAAAVVITEQLDADVDWTSFELGEFGFGNETPGSSGYTGATFSPAEGTQSFFEERTVSVPVYDTAEAPVEVLLRGSASFDADAGAATWRIEVLDPETGEAPVDGLVGFLPPEPIDDEGAGKGFAAYRVDATQGLATGTELTAQARIVFDQNDPIDTNTWVNTVDAGGPSASVSALPSTSVSPFKVGWSGTDDAGGPTGSGVGSFDVFVSVDGGPLQAWLSDTKSTSRKFSGVVGHTYGFAARGADSVGHVGPLPGGPQSTTRVVVAPPPPPTTTTTTSTTTAPSTTTTTAPSTTTTTAPSTTTTTTAPDTGGLDVERRGFVVLAGDGGVFTFGGASFHGSLAGLVLNGDSVTVLRTPSGRGYYVVTSDGGVFAFGDATFRGSLGGMVLNAPIVDAALTPSGRGYLLVGADGGVFAFGDAEFFGSMAGEHLNGPVVAVMMAPGAEGYWLVASDGGVFSFGEVGFFGSLGSALCPACSEATSEERVREMLAARIVDGAPSPDGDGYWLVGADGGVFAFGRARYRGSLGWLSLDAPIVEIAATGTGGGYRLAGADGGLFSFGDAYYQGSLAHTHLVAPITALGT